MEESTSSAAEADIGKENDTRPSSDESAEKSVQPQKIEEEHRPPDTKVKEDEAKRIETEKQGEKSDDGLSGMIRTEKNEAKSDVGSGKITEKIDDKSEEKPEESEGKQKESVKTSETQQKSEDTLKKNEEPVEGRSDDKLETSEDSANVEDKESEQEAEETEDRTSATTTTETTQIPSDVPMKIEDKVPEEGTTSENKASKKPSNVDSAKGPSPIDVLTEKSEEQSTANSHTVTVCDVVKKAVSAQENQEYSASASNEIRKPIEQERPSQSSTDGNSIDNNDTKKERCQHLEQPTNPPITSSSSATTVVVDTEKPIEAPASVKNIAEAEKPLTSSSIPSSSSKNEPIETQQDSVLAEAAESSAEKPNSKKIESTPSASASTSQLTSSELNTTAADTHETAATEGKQDAPTTDCGQQKETPHVDPNQVIGPSKTAKEENTSTSDTKASEKLSDNQKDQPEKRPLFTLSPGSGSAPSSPQAQSSNKLPISSTNANTVVSSSLLPSICSTTTTNSNQFQLPFVPPPPSQQHQQQFQLPPLPRQPSNLQLPQPQSAQQPQSQPLINLSPIHQLQHHHPHHHHHHQHHQPNAPSSSLSAKLEESKTAPSLLIPPHSSAIGIAPGDNQHSAVVDNQQHSNLHHSSSSNTGGVPLKKVKSMDEKGQFITSFLDEIKNFEERNLFGDAVAGETGEAAEALLSLSDLDFNNLLPDDPSTNLLPDAPDMIALMGNSPVKEHHADDQHHDPHVLSTKSSDEANNKPDHPFFKTDHIPSRPNSVANPESLRWSPFAEISPLKRCHSLQQPITPRSGVSIRSLLESMTHDDVDRVINDEKVVVPKEPTKISMYGYNLQRIEAKDLDPSVNYVATSDIFQNFFSKRHWDEFKTILERNLIKPRVVTPTGTLDSVEVISVEELEQLLRSNEARKEGFVKCIKMDAVSGQTYESVVERPDESAPVELASGIRTRHGDHSDIEYVSLNNATIPSVSINDQQWVRLPDVLSKVLNIQASKHEVQRIRTICGGQGIPVSKVATNVKWRLTAHAGSTRSNSLHIIPVSCLPILINHLQKRKRRKEAKLPPHEKKLKLEDSTKDETNWSDAELSSVEETLSSEYSDYEDSDDEGKSKEQTGQAEMEQIECIPIAVPPSSREPEDVASRLLTEYSFIEADTVAKCKPAIVSLPRSAPLKVAVSKTGTATYHLVGSYWEYLFQYPAAPCVECQCCEEIFSIQAFLRHTHYLPITELHNVKLYMYIAGLGNTSSAPRFDIWDRLNRRLRDFGMFDLCFEYPDHLIEYYQNRWSNKIGPPSSTKLKTAISTISRANRRTYNRGSASVSWITSTVESPVDVQKMMEDAMAAQTPSNVQYIEPIEPITPTPTRNLLQTNPSQNETTNKIEDDLPFLPWLYPDGYNHPRKDQYFALMYGGRMY